MRIIFFIFIVIMAVSALDLKELAKDEWTVFKQYYNKKYTNSVEDWFRMKIYLQNRHKIAKHNKERQNTFKVSMNQFGDLLPHEFARLQGHRQGLQNASSNILPRVTFLTPENFLAPNEVDWRTKGYVTRVKNQGHCGSCWAFSATGSLEGQHFRKTGTLVALSEQNLMDCSRDEGNEGCGGGLITYAFNYIQNNHGIDTEEGYPYEAVDGECRFNADKVGAYVNGYVEIDYGDEKKLMQAVASTGPISVGISVIDSFRFYSTGVYVEPQCRSSIASINHAVLVVGYGTEDGKDYWIVKNSWGSIWGDRGYIKMARNLKNQCGIASMASYPLV